MKNLIFIVLIFNLSISFSQDGSYDLTFGNNGSVEYFFEGDDLNLRSFNTDQNNRILVVLKSYDFTTNETITRVIGFNENGEIDTLFGDNGFIILPYEDDYIEDIHFLSNDTFLIRVYEFGYYHYVKYNYDGEIDTTFASDGFLQPYLNGDNGAKIIIDEDNNLFFVGYNNLFPNPSFYIYKYNSIGHLDEAFGNNGIATYTIENTDTFSAGILEIFNEKIYLRVNYEENGLLFRTLTRFNLDGSIDYSFGNNGYLTIPVEEPFINLHCSLFENGDFLIGASYWDEPSETVIRKTYKLNTLGNIIQNFGDGGEINGFAGGIIQENQRFISSIYSYDWEGGVSPYLVRFFANGDSDSSFNFQGNYGEYNNVGFKLLNSGKILLAGTDVWYNGPDLHLHLKRFNNDPLGVSDFETKNLIVTPIPTTGKFTVQNLIFNSENPKYQIIDISGKIIKKGILESTEDIIDISSSENGIYFLKIQNQTFKLIKK